MAVSQVSVSKPIVSPNKKKKSNKNLTQSHSESDPVQNQQEEAPLLPQPPSYSPSKRTKCPGVRVVGGRIYDRENGKTCHQCRQKTMDFSASCKNRKNDNLCPQKFCHKCLLNRYGEKAEEMAMLDEWKCPKCRGICNCSVCMKRRGHQPTGLLVHTAKATGFSSVSEMLNLKGPENLALEETKQTALNKDPVATPIRKCGKENSFDGKNDSKSQPVSSISDGKGDKGECRSKKVRHNDNAGEGGITTASLKKHKAFKNVVATPNEHTTPNKEPVTFPTRKYFKEKNDSNLQPTPSTLDCEVKKREESRRKKLRQKDSAGKGSKCGNSLFEKKSSKVSQNSEENPQKLIKKEEKRSQCNDGCPNKVNSELQIPKKTSLDPRKKEGKKDEGDSFLPDCDKTVLYGNMDNATTRPKLVTKSRGARKNTMTTNTSSVDIQLPQGANLTIVAGIDLATDDVGHALQFLEFCAAFGQVLDLKKGQPESILQELLCRRSGRRIHRTQYSSNVQFHTQLLSLIQKDLGEKSHLLSKTSSRDSWLKALGKCISESHFVLKDLPVDCFDRGGDSYDKLDSSQKLRVLNFLCDETLGTVKLRNWIDEQNSKFVEREKEAKEKVLAAKNKEKCLKRKLLDDVAKAIQLKNGAPLSISEHEYLVSRIKVEAAKAHSEILEAMGMVPKKKQRSDAVRTEPVLLDGDGCAYWKLRCYSSEPILLLQDIDNLDWVRPEEKWYTYDVEQTKVVENYISSFRTKGIKSVAVSGIFPLGSSEGSLKHESPDIVVVDSEDDQES
ncbi:uncharacterized protein LOC122093188 [Macadamia integrifolia]|uniref:uncharacterized protein LOC122093188 n=1 Tax=Macadamia integrifolia TaxID=60698 RepID=UPI001C52FD08|nr:uncharacterized protein LOC122093188 [Macadamia integrifolia]